MKEPHKGLLRPSHGSFVCRNKKETPGNVPRRSCMPLGGGVSKSYFLVSFLFGLSILAICFEPVLSSFFNSGN